MARTNATLVTEKPVTHEGGKAERIGASEELLRVASSTMLFENTFYESGDDIAKHLAKLVRENKPERVAEVARLCRGELKLRHAPLWLAVQLAIAHAGKNRTLVRETIRDVIQRPDELAEVLALYFKYGEDRGKNKDVGGKRRLPIPAAMKLGLADAYAKFDEYRLAKWNRQDREVKLRDVLFLSHPKASSEALESLWRRLVEGSLATPDTWEVAYSAAKSKDEKRAIWERLIAGENGRTQLGGHATLMNMRNMVEAGLARPHVVKALDNIGPHSRLLPFRFVAAAQFAPAFAQEISDAMLRAVAGVGRLGGTTALVLDNSGSMTGATISEKSKMDRVAAAGALGILLREVSDDCRVFVYSTDCTEVRNLRGLALIDEMRKQPSGGTNTAAALLYARSRVPEADRVILITDEQAHDGIVENWGKRGGYLVNVAPYKPGLESKSKGWHRINGWSERLVDWISLEETGKILGSEAEVEQETAEGAGG